MRWERKKSRKERKLVLNFVAHLDLIIVQLVLNILSDEERIIQVINKREDTYEEEVFLN